MKSKKTKLFKYTCGGILDDINNASLEIFNLQVTSNKYSHTEFSFVDANFLFKDSDDDILKKLFKFTPGSPNSIVKNYNITFTTPKNRRSQIDFISINKDKANWINKINN